MKNALILHGAGNNSQGNWFPWLKKELEERGYETWVPDLPNADVPNLKEWLEVIFSNKAWQFNDESILIGHSSGATLILRILAELPENTKVKEAVLVAAFVELGIKAEYFPYKRSLVEHPFPWAKIKNACNQFFFVCSDNDPYQCGCDQANIMREHLGGEIILQPGEAHFNLEQGPEYKEFPLLLKLL